MELHRDLYARLLEWKQNCQGSRALLLEGARRVGKTTLARKFAAEQYDSFVFIDFNLAPKRVLANFENLNNLEVFFQNLSLEYNVRLHRRKSLFVFDEIQRFPKAREALKYLVADGRYDYLETGSLISIHENVKDITIPSEERKLRMNPLTFREFALAQGEELLLEHLRECFLERRAVQRSLHDKAMRIFREYLLVGGMPQSVTAYLQEDRDFESSDIQKRDILSLYRDDIKKAAHRYSSKVSALFEHLPGYLSMHEKKVVLSKIAAGGTFAAFDDPLFWLADAMICNLCVRCTDPNLGPALHADPSSVKCYLADTGLLVSLALGENASASQQLYRSIMNGRLSLNEGMLFENCVAQMLTAAGRKLFFYTRYNALKHRNDLEIDFLLTDETKLPRCLTPLEVKSSKNYTTRSLDAFSQLFAGRVGQRCIVHSKGLVAEEDLLRIPPYMLEFFLMSSAERRPL